MMEELLATFEQLIDNFASVVNSNTSVLPIGENEKKTIFTHVKNKSIDGMNVENICDLIVNICDDLSIDNFNYLYIASMILSYKNNKTIEKFVPFRENTIDMFIAKTNYINDQLPNFLNQQYIDFVNCEDFYFSFKNIDFSYTLPYYMDLFSYKTLEGSYLLKVHGVVVEHPCDLFLRVSVAVHFRSVDYNTDTTIAMFDSMYNGYYTHATPTMYNAGTILEQMSSCFLLGTEDSLDGIFKTQHDEGRISKCSGGIGVHVSNVRCKGSRIVSTNGESSGIIPMLKLYNDVAVYINQGGRGQKRPGAIAVYLEPWHGDIKEFLQLKMPNGEEKLRARDLFLALWIPDLFMKQIECDGDWYLMCPNVAKGLQDVYGEEFETLYYKYVEEGKYVEKIKALDLLPSILASLGQTGIPYIMFKDNVNRRSNQDNIGVIKSSNLCTEITEYSDSKNYAVCNLSSICVNRFVNADKTYNFEKLKEVASMVTLNLNNIIDNNFYPTPECRLSNSITRPIGIGIQGISNLFYDLKLPYDSPEAIELEARIMETIYYGAIWQSMELAKRDGPYDKFHGSHFERGEFQFDMNYNIDRTKLMWDWDTLKQLVMKHGTRNSLLTALMPTASTSQIMNNYESFEVTTSNIVTRKTSVGLFKVINKQLVTELANHGLWNTTIKNKIVSNEGSIQNIDEIPLEIKNIYKTVWEIKQKVIMNHAIARAPFVDQSQSMNLYFEKIDAAKTKGSLLYAWRNGLKTGSYYTHTQSSSQPMELTDNKEQTKEQNQTCSIQSQKLGIPCDSCSA